MPSTSNRKNRKGNNMDYEIKSVYGHYEVYINGKFYCSADSIAEAEMEIKAIVNNTKLM